MGVSKTILRCRLLLRRVLARRLGLVVLALVTLLPSSTALAQSIAIDPPTPHAGDTVRLHYQFTQRGGYKYLSFSGCVENNYIWEWVVSDMDGQPQMSGVLECTAAIPNLNDTLTSATARIVESTHPAVDHHTYIINPVEEIPGLLQLDRTSFLPNEVVPLSVRYPDFPVSLYVRRDAGLTREGVLVAPYNGGGYSVFEEAGSNFDFHMPQTPGDYELQVRDADGFVLDRQTISVLRATPSVPLRIESDNALRVGAPIRIVPELPDSALWNTHTMLAKVLKRDATGQWVVVYYHHIGINPGLLTGSAQSGSDPQSQLVDSAFEFVIGDTSGPGPYRFLLTWLVYYDGYRSEVFAGEKSFHVFPAEKEEPGPQELAFEFPDGHVYLQGTEYELILVGDARPHIDGDVTVNLYRVATIQETVTPVSFEDPEPVHAWVVAPPEGVMLPADLEPGFYSVAALGVPAMDLEEEERLRQQGSWPPPPYLASSEQFVVLPAPDAFAVSVSSGERVVVGRDVEFTVTLPEGSEFLDGHLALEFARLPGEFRDCSILMQKLEHRFPVSSDERTISVGSIDDRGQIWHAMEHGRYEARLLFHPNRLAAVGPYHYQNSWGGGPTVLASAPFDLQHEALPGAIELLTSQPEPRPVIEARVTLPPDFSVFPGNQRNALHLDLYRATEVAASGAVRPPPQSVQGFTVDAETGRTQDIKMTVHSFGPHELRLTSRCAGTAECPIIVHDRLAVDVAPAEPGVPLTIGLGEDDLDGMNSGRVYPEHEPLGACTEDEIKSVTIVKPQEPHDELQDVAAGDRFRVLVEFEQNQNADVTSIEVTLNSLNDLHAMVGETAFQANRITDRLFITEIVSVEEPVQ